MLRIENNRIIGSMTVVRGFGKNTSWDGVYTVKINFDGTDINLLAKHAVNDAIIVHRKYVKSREQAEKLENGILFGTMVQATPKDPDSMAAAVDVDAMSPEAVDEMIRRLQSRKAKNLQTGEDIE